MAEHFETLVNRICSTSDLEAAASELFHFIRCRSEIEGVFLGHHHPGSRQVLNMSYVGKNDSRRLDSIRGASTELHSYLLSTRRQDFNVFPVLGSFQALADSVRDFIPANHTMYEFRLRMDGKHLAMLAFHSSRHCLDDEMVKFLMKIRNPLAMAVANRLLSSGFPPDGFLVGGQPDIASPSLSPCNARKKTTSETTCRAMAPFCSPVMRKLTRLMERVALADTGVLLTGETGVGKEVLARRIHALSHRKDKPFVHVNCGGIAESLVDSELFGHEKGAFTGSTQQHCGFFEQAQDGTIFLDEIGEMPLASQARLLLVLQNKTIRRVGGRRSIPLNFRLIAATNIDLRQACKEGRFRTDLYYRISTIPLHVPPLRERKEDIPALAEYFLDKFSAEFGLPAVPKPSDMDVRNLLEYAWPGNVRELASHIERYVLLHSEIGAAPWFSVGEELFSMPAHSLSAFDANPLHNACFGAWDGIEPKSMFLNQRMYEHMEHALRLACGRIHGPGGAAELLGINASTLRSRLRKAGIPFGRKEK